MLYIDKRYRWKEGVGDIDKRYRLAPLAPLYVIWVVLRFVRTDNTFAQRHRQANAEF